MPQQTLPECLVALEMDAVRRWLGRMLPTDVCGIAGEPDSCPLAVYLAEANGLKRDDERLVVTVDPLQYSLDLGTPEGLVTCPTPDWAQRFIDRVDSLIESSDLGEDKKVTARIARGALDRAVRYSTSEDEDCAPTRKDGVFMSAVILEDTPARADLETILEGVAAQYGLRTALEVVETVRRAAVEGRIDGRNYVACDCTRADCEEKAVCVIGHIALALNSFEDDGIDDHIPVVPNWTYHTPDTSPIERLVEDVHPGDTPATSSYLRTLVFWLDNWRALRA